MKKLIIFLLLPLWISCDSNKKDSSTPTTEEVAYLPISTYYLIRHAEKDIADPENEDPFLSEKGTDRALLWERIFLNITFDEIYSTNTMRSLQTVTAVGMDNNTEVKIYETKDLINDEFLKETLGKNVLIVGHSNTIPKIANELIKDEYFKDMDDNDYGSVYVITLAGTGKKAEIINLK